MPTSIRSTNAYALSIHLELQVASFSSGSAPMTSLQEGGGGRSLQQSPANRQFPGRCLRTRRLPLGPIRHLQGPPVISGTRKTPQPEAIAEIKAWGGGVK